MIAVALPVAAGLYVHTRADYVIGLTDRATRLERERELLADQAVAEERVRIARELHDVVAHNVSLMVVQAQALAATGQEPSHEATLGVVADLGREALSEMHRMLGVLRLGDLSETTAERTPQPGVRDLSKLITRTHDTGLETTFVVEGQARELPAAVDLSAYRIVQEALTNVIRHARAKHAEVILAYRAEAVEVTVTDDGSGPSETQDDTSPGGHGLVGMRERVALFGGRFSAGRAESGTGFRVHASLPLS
jgi:signal transduction histidine kinase